MKEEYGYFSLNNYKKIRKIDIKKGFFHNNFSWPNDSRDLPGPFVKQCIENNLVSIDEIYNWIDEYLITDSFSFSPIKISKCAEILSIYNCGISKDSILKMYNLFIEEYEADNINGLTLGSFLFKYVPNNLICFDCNHDTCYGIIPYLKMYGLNDEFNIACEIYENFIKETKKDKKYAIYINKDVNSFSSELFANTCIDTDEKIALIQYKYIIDELTNDYNYFLKYINIVKEKEMFKHIAKRTILLGIEHNFDENKINEEIKNGTCKLYADD